MGKKLSLDDKIVKLKKILEEVPSPPSSPIFVTHLGWAYVGRGQLGSAIVWQVWDDAVFAAAVRLEDALLSWGIRKLKREVTMFPSQLPPPLGKAKFILRGSDLLVEVDLPDHSHSS